jgi:hypothetical protein
VNLRLSTAMLFLIMAVCGQAADPLPQPAARYTFDADAAVMEPDAAGIGPAALIASDPGARPLSVREPGRFGKALRPTERGSVQTVFPADDRFTVSFWINPDQLYANGIFRCGDQVLILLNRHTPLLEARVGSARLSTPIAVGQWMCVVLRSDGRRATLFLNGVRAGEAVINIPLEVRGQQTLLANIGGAHGQYAGLFDEARIYDVALTDEQIALLSDPERCLEELPPSVDAGIDHTLALEEGGLLKPKTAEVSLTGRVSGALEGRVGWQVLAAPEGAQVRFADATTAETAVALDRPGDYQLALHAENAYGRARDTIRITVFPPWQSAAGKPASDLRTPGTVGDPLRPPHPKVSPYDPAFAAEWFPLMVPEQHLEGYDASRFRRPPPPGIHPRIFFNPEDLPDMRHRLRYTRAGRTALARISSLLQVRLGDLSPDRPLPAYFRVETDDKGNAKNVSDMRAAALHCYSAFLALIEADLVRARQVIDEAMQIADVQEAALDAVPPEKHNDWQGTYHIILGRYATSYVYDFLYGWMTDAERARLRRIISRCTAKKSSIGMFAVEAQGRSNWQSWVTGDLLANILAIEGEEGFDPVVYEEAANALRRFWRNGVFADGAMNEGMGKNSITAQNLMALAKRGDHSISSVNIYNHVAKYLLHTMQPYGYRFIEDDLWGGSRNLALMSDVSVLKFAYPDDPVIDFVYRNTAGDRYDWPMTQTTYCYGSDLVACWTALDWEGDPDWDRNAQVALKNEPLDYAAHSINLYTARSGWNRDAAYLYFLPRMLGGHASPARGTFVFSALGRDWSLYPTGHNNKSSLQHSVVTVDGKSAGAQWARMSSYESTPELMMASCDLREVYSHMTLSDATLDDFRLEKGMAPWTRLPLWQLPNWFDGDRPEGLSPNPDNQAAERDRLVHEAKRTAAFLRTNPPSVLLVDDFDIDGQEHLYRWQMVLPPELVDHAVVDGREATVTDPATGNRLVVRLLRANGEVSGRVEALDTAVNQHARGESAAIVFETRAASPEFVVLLTALRPGETAPERLIEKARAFVHN